ncbi:FG-GAP repeat domain-containing protein [Nitrospina watsonii]|uniref:VCBS repeat-containing protein n=1 Tax=Nitrospina watsonii TaxID=1323948 RepID=A0ABM9HAW9_9BACT|nr:VCBS repeat-containing protein [Nitrospina watsonii]CAI2717265.1 conserved protein of unknown function [Nitrospina watsonii]
MPKLSLYRRSLLSVFAVLLLISFWTNSIWAAGGLDRMAEQIEASFPVVKGHVLAVEGEGVEVLIDLKKGQAVNPGDVLKVLRLGLQIVHPVTGEVVGRKETDIGTIEVVEVRTNYSVARVRDTLQPIQNGDTVQSRFRKMVFLVAPVMQEEGLRLDTQALGLSLERTLNQRPRMEVPAFGLQAWMLEHGLQLADLMAPQNLALLDQEIDIDFLLLSKVETVKGQTVLRYRVVAVEDGAVLQESRVVFDEHLALAAPKQDDRVQTDLGGGKRGQDLVHFVAKQEFDFALVDFDVGDLDGDGEPEFVFIDRHQVMIYRYARGRYDKVGVIRVKPEFNRFLAVDVADINGNGRAEIFVTNQSGKELSSFILERAPDAPRFQKIATGLKRYFRVIRSYKGEAKLLTQHQDLEKPFKPGIFTMHYSKGEYVEKTRLKIDTFLDQTVTLYGLALEDTNFDKSIEIIVLDNDYKLRVYSADGKMLVKSDEYYGHDPRQIDVGLKDQPYVDFTDPYIPKAVRYRGRLTMVENRDQRFLLVPKNHRLGGSWLSNLVVINNSSLEFLAVTKEGLEQVYETQKQKGYLAAYQAMDVGTSRKQVHVAMVSDKGGLFKDEKMTTFFVYDWR